MLSKIEEESSESLKKLKKSVYTLLETYSNVHRGTGHNSMITTALFEHARQIILSYLKLDNKNHVVVFCSPRRLSIFKFQLKPSDYLVISSEDYGLPLGIRALAVKKKSLQKCSSIYTGGGMIRHVTSNTVVWADVPERFESGTPSIVNIITLVIAFQLGDFYGKSFSENLNNQILTPDEILYQDDLMDYSGKELLKKMKKSLVGYKALVPTNDGFQHFINLDNAASTPTFLPIWDTYRKTLSQYNKNSQKLILEVKSICSEFLDAPLDKYSIIFTSNTTEAINLVAHSLRRSLKKKKDTVIINSELEHHSNELPFRYISNSSLIRISINDEGFINLNELEDILKEYNEEHKYGIKRVKIVAVCGVSNVLGTYTDLKLISEITHKYNAQLLVDGAQLVAHHKVSINKLDIDYFAFSGHKVYAPFGSGVLVVKKGYLNFNDNDMKDIESSGEENLVGIATLGKALILLNKISMETIEEYEKKLTRLAIKKLKNMKDVEVFGVIDHESSKFQKRGSIVAFSLKTVPHNLAAKELAEYGGIGVRDGCFCAHILVQKILRIPKIRLRGAELTSIIIPEKTRMCLPGLLRISFGIENEESDVEILSKTIEILMKKPRSQLDKLLGYTNNGTLFVPKTKTEQKIRTFVSLIAKRVYLT